MVPKTILKAVSLTCLHHSHIGHCTKCRFIWKTQQSAGHLNFLGDVTTLTLEHDQHTVSTWIHLNLLKNQQPTYVTTVWHFSLSFLLFIHSTSIVTPNPPLTLCTILSNPKAGEHHIVRRGLGAGVDKVLLVKSVLSYQFLFASQASSHSASERHWRWGK